MDDLQHGAAGARLWVVGGEDQPTDPRMQQSSGAHGARFQGRHEDAIKQTVIAESDAGFTECDDFGVRGGIMRAQDAVVASAEDLPRRGNDDRTDRYLTGGFGECCFVKGEPHPCLSVCRRRELRSGDQSGVRSGCSHGASLAEVLPCFVLKRRKQRGEHGPARFGELACRWQPEAAGKFAQGAAQRTIDIGEEVKASIAADF